MIPAEPCGHILSVILPNYNHAPLIPRALAALLAQDRPADEIIVIDDGSTDGSLAVIEDIARRAPSVRVLVNPRNQGVIPTLRRGLEAARGRYVYFAAADDWVAPGFFALALDLLEAHPRSGFFCGEAALVDGETGDPLGYRPVARPRRGTGEVPAERVPHLLARIDNWILTGSAIFRRDSLLAAGGLDDRLGSSADSFLARKIALIQGFCFAPVVVATWCIFSSGASRMAALHDAEKMLKLIPAAIAADPAFPPWYAELFGRRWRFATSRLALESAPVNQHFLRAMAATSRLDDAVFTAIWAAPSSLARLATLAWLWLRLHPTSLVRVVATTLARRHEMLRQRPRSRS